MEKHRIGTDASIASHIQSIVSREYVTVGQVRFFIHDYFNKCKMFIFLF